MVTDRQARCVVGTEPLTSTTRGPNARGRLAALTLAVALAAPAIPALAQQLPVLATVAQAAPADAKTALNAAVAQFKAGQYEEALTALQAIRADSLSADDQKLLADTTSQAQQATESRRAARADFEKGQKALESGDNATAQSLFKSVAATDTEVVPTEPAFAANVVTIPTSAGVDYYRTDTNALVADGATITLDDTVLPIVEIEARPAAGYYFPDNLDSTDTWTFEYQA